MKNYKHILSLGKDCQVANYLGKKYLITWGDVFDNMVTLELSGIIRFFENDMQRFFDKDHIESKGLNQFGKTTVIDQMHSIISVHDFGVDFQQSYDNFLIRKTIKISKLKQIINEEEPILFVRKNKENEPIENTVRLIDCLKKIRQDLEFDLMVLQKNDFFTKNWGIECLHTYYDEEWTWDGDWRGNTYLWDSIFNQVSISKKVWGGKRNFPFL